MKLKKVLAILLGMVVITSSVTAFASGIPPESMPEGATPESVEITETLISGVLDEVQAGAGFAQVWYKANNAIWFAINSGQTNGHGYGILAPIARNAILQCRDMYMRPEYYAETEKYIKPLIEDLITKVKNGECDYNTAKREAYVRVLQATDNTFNPDSCYMTDFCYWDLPTIDPVKFVMVRKLLLN